ncbi:cytochrome P450 [Vararia minispora EC-137]|uniref:Cytochrome P450 n=1 Tax=Vararia minispora EC-137 TaxID=1314806 RepID=A0ACB8QEB1_9AGAM|nr:cytochrome P450 [Vararia minispora EC-137]
MRPLPYPPGPQGWPLVGNLLDMPRTRIWDAFSRFREQYGDIMYMNVLGQPIVVISSVQIAQDLLDKRGAIYSDRPQMRMAGDLCGFIDTLPIMPYGPRFRYVRQLMHKFMGPRTNVEKHARVEEQEAARLLLRILRDPRPESLQEHVRKAAGGIILKLAYGYPTQEDDDPFVKQADKVVAQFSQVVVPGAFLVDIISPLRYVPDWLPGAGFKRFAKSCKREMHELVDMPMEWVRRQQEKVFDNESFVAMHEHNLMSTEDQDVLKFAAGTLYGGAFPSCTVSSLYSLFLALALNPDVQKKAQTEVDRVVGTERLPALSDRKDLPYIEALVKELLRWNTVAPTGLPHRLTEDDTYNGYFLPKGSVVIANIHCMLHDESIHRDAARFRPERFLPEEGEMAEQDPLNICFGFGRRICPGKTVSENSIFLVCAMVAAVLDVSKAIKDGVVVEPVFEHVGGSILHPKEFCCAIKPRSANAAKLVFSSVELNS